MKHSITAVLALAAQRLIKKAKRFSCIALSDAFNRLSGNVYSAKTEDSLLEWYAETAVRMMNKLPRPNRLSVAAFGDVLVANPKGGTSDSRNHRIMWLTWLITIVRAGQILPPEGFKR